MNNRVKVIVMTAMVVFFAAASVRAETDSVIIKTSALCEQCKKRIERDLAFEKGIKKSELNLETNEVTVLYEAKKTDADKIRVAITKIGYDADSLKANAKAFKRLPECCRVPGLHH